MKSTRAGICSRSESTFGLSRVKWTLSKVMWTTCLMPLPSWHDWSVVVVVLGTEVVVAVVLDVVLELSVVVVTSVVDVVSVAVVVVVVVLVVVVVVDVVVGESAATTSFTQPSTTVSRVAAVVVLEQSVADVSLAIAAANLLSASARQAVGSVPLVACLDRHPSSADAFLAAAATFFESHLLSVGLLSLAPTAARTLLSHVPRAETTALALPGQESWRSAFAKSFATFAPGLASQGASGAFPFDSAFASHLSVPEIALPEDLSLVPPHLSARAIAGGASNAMATARTTERRGECMSGLASQVSPRANGSRTTHVCGMTARLAAVCYRRPSQR